MEPAHILHSSTATHQHNHTQESRAGEDSSRFVGSPSLTKSVNPRSERTDTTPPNINSDPVTVTLSRYARSVITVPSNY